MDWYEMMFPAQQSEEPSLEKVFPEQRLYSRSWVKTRQAGKKADAGQAGLSCSEILSSRKGGAKLSCRPVVGNFATGCGKNIKTGRTQGIAPTESGAKSGGRGKQRPYASECK